MILESENQVQTGRRLLRDFPERETRIATFCYDIDIKSAYPTGNSITNGCKENTLFESCKAEDDKGDKYLLRDIGLNLTSGVTNASHICRKMLNYPDNNDLLKGFKETL